MSEERTFSSATPMDACVSGHSWTPRWTPSTQVRLFPLVSGVAGVISGHESLKVSLPGKKDSLPPVCSVLCLPEEVVCGDADGKVSFWDRRFGTQLCGFKRLVADVSVLTSLAHQGLRYVLAAGKDAAVAVFRKSAAQSAKWEYVFQRRPHVNDIHCLVPFRAKKMNVLLTASQDCEVRFTTCPEDGDIVKAFNNKGLSKTLDALPERPLFQLVLHPRRRVLMVVLRKNIDLWHIPHDPDVDSSIFRSGLAQGVRFLGDVGGEDGRGEYRRVVRSSLARLSAS